MDPVLIVVIAAALILLILIVDRRGKKKAKRSERSNRPVDVDASGNVIYNPDEKNRDDRDFDDDRGSSRRGSRSSRSRGGSRKRGGSHHRGDNRSDDYDRSRAKAEKNYSKASADMETILRDYNDLLDRRGYDKYQMSEKLAQNTPEAQRIRDNVQHLVRWHQRMDPTDEREVESFRRELENLKQDWRFLEDQPLDR